MRKYIFPLLITFFVVFSLWPTLHELRSRDKLSPERSFELVHNYYTDYNFYLSRIRQGLEGNRLVYEKYTSEPHAGSLIQIFYLALGWAGRWAHVPWDRPADVYHVARIVFGVALLAAIAEFCKRSFAKSTQVGAVRGSFFAAHPSSRLEALAGDGGRGFTLWSNPKGIPKKGSSCGFSWGKARGMTRWEQLRMTVLEKTRRAAPILCSPDLSLLAFLLAVTASTWPILVKAHDGWRLGGYMPWWSVMDSLQRITFIPHLLAGQTFMVFLLTALSDREVFKKGGNWILLGLLGFLLGLIFPPGLYFIYATIVALMVFEALLSPRGLTALLKPVFILEHVAPRLVFISISFPTIIYFGLMMTLYPWKRLVEFDLLNPTKFSYLEYFKAVGPVLIFGLLGGILALIKKEKGVFVAVAWVGMWLVLLGLFSFIPQQSPLRFTEMIPQVPLAILTAYLFYSLWRRAAVSASRRIPARFSFVIRNLSFIIPAALILLGGGVMYSSWLWQRDFIDMKTRAGYPVIPMNNYIVYPTVSFTSGIRFFQSQTPRDAIVLSEGTAGNYIPAYSGNTVYLGHSNTVKLEQKLPVVKQFFAGLMPVGEAQTWLTRERIAYIFFGPEERQEGGIANLNSIYQFLREVYRNDSVVIYQFP